MKKKYTSSNRCLAFVASLILLAGFLAATPASRADTIYVSNWNNDTIGKFDSVTGKDFGTFVDIRGPRGITLDSAGNIYAIEWTSQSIVKYTPAGVRSVFATGLQGSESLAFDGAGNLYVGNNWNKTIVKYTSAAVGSVFASTGVNEADGLAFDRAGNLFVATGPGNTIQKITPEGVGSVFATGLYNPNGMAFDNAGNLFVANYWGPYYGGPSIQKFTPEGVSSVVATGMTDPAGIAFDSAGNLYVADQWAGPNYGSIKKITPDGTVSVFASIYYGGPTSIAIQVPEPSALALLGLGLLALPALRRLINDGAQFRRAITRSVRVAAGPPPLGTQLIRSGSNMRPSDVQYTLGGITRL